jgi:hypothetical protein
MRIYIKAFLFLSAWMLVVGGIIHLICYVTDNEFPLELYPISVAAAAAIIPLSVLFGKTAEWVSKL